MSPLAPSRYRFFAVLLLLIVVATGYLLPTSETIRAETSLPKPVEVVQSEGKFDRASWIASRLYDSLPNDAPAEGNTWYEYAHLSAPDASMYDMLGWSVSVSGDTAVVAATIGDSTTAAESGAAYVYVRSGNIWSLQQKITPSDGSADDRFGSSVALYGDTIVVGAYYDDTPGGVDSGSAYVFTRNGTVWTEQQKLTPSDAASGDFFGYSVSISGNTLIVGAVFDDTAAGVDAGSAYVFSRNGNTWSEQQKLTPNDGAAGNRFGFSVSINGDSTVIGAPSSTGANPGSGSAYVYSWIGSSWTGQQKLFAPAGGGGNFGNSVSVNGDTLVVGAPSNNSQRGKAYVFVKSFTEWSMQQALTALEGNIGHFFGSSASVSGDTIIIGANQSQGLTGQAYAFVRNGSTWIQEQTLNPSDGASGDGFGRSVSISGDVAFVGSPSHDATGILNAGSAYVFHRTSLPPPPTPTPTATPTPSPTPTPASGRALSVVPTYAVRGGSASVPVEFYSLGNEVAMSFSIYFDPGILSSPVVALGSGVPPGMVLTVNPNQVLSGRLGILVDASASFSASPPARHVITITFLVSPNASLGSTPLTFAGTPTPRSISDRFGNPLTATYSNGSVSIQPGIEADLAGGDGQVLANDVTLMRQFSVGNLTPSTVDQCKRIDVAPIQTYGDGQISSNDVIGARLYAVGNLPLSIVDGPVCGPGAGPAVNEFESPGFDSTSDILGDLDENIFWPDRREIKIGKAHGRKGSTVTFPIELSSNGGETALSFTLEYDAAVLSDPRLSLEDAPHDAILTTNLAHSGKIGVLVDSQNELGRAKAGSPPRRIVLVTFDIANDAAPGEIPVTLTDALARRSVSDAAGNSVAAHFAGGKILIETQDAKRFRKRSLTW